MIVSCKKDKPDPQPHSLNYQPGSDGQDAYVAKIDNNATDGNTNLDFANEIVLGRWTNASGDPASFRSFIKFKGLSEIPSSASITSARLYLYGVSSSISFPGVGNSSYPGSPNGDNTSVIERVTADWDETTITWNNKPATSSLNQVTLPASTARWSYSTNVDVTNLVKAMVAESKNYGFSLKLSNESLYRSYLFATSEATDPAMRLKLVVEAVY